MMVPGNDSDQYFGWRVPTPLVQGLTGTGRLVPRFRYTKHMLAGWAHIVSRNKQEIAFGEMLQTALGSVGGRPVAAD